MPQLMPLFWVISNIFIFFFGLSMIILFSLNMLKFENLEFKKNKMINMIWCW